MKTSTMSKTAYVQDFGPVGTAGRMSEETMELWEKIKKLPVVEFLVVEPDKGDDYKKVRGALYQRLLKLADKIKPNFKVRLAVNHHEKHVVIWKEALPDRK
jgi:hypothetical protein